MSDYTLAPQSDTILGMTGSGKTTFAFRVMLNTPASARFIFDDLGQASNRLRIPLCGTFKELEASLASRWSLFNPHIEYPGETKRAFKDWCKWVFNTSRRGNGKKLVFIDEAWRWQDRDEIPVEFAMLSQMGRAENIRLLTATQEPHRMNSSILGSATEMICFRLQESVELAKVRGLGGNAAEVAKLPLGSFISYNRLKGTARRGRIF